jgi:hypothetical protein
MPGDGGGRDSSENSMELPGRGKSPRGFQRNGGLVPVPPGVLECLLPLYHGLLGLTMAGWGPTPVGTQTGTGEG